MASELTWSAREAAGILRALDPRVAALPLSACLAVPAAETGPQSLLWALGLWLLAAVSPGTVRRLASARRDLLAAPRPAAYLAEATGPLLATGLVLGLDGSRLLLILPAVAMAVTAGRALRGAAWAPALHVPGVAAATAALTAMAGVAAAPSLLLVPLVGWARVKVGAETPGRVVWAGLWGAALALLALYVALVR